MAGRELIDSNAIHVSDVDVLADSSVHDIDEHDILDGPGGRLRGVQCVSKIEAWHESGGRSPNEQAMKVRLRELLGS